MPLFRLTLTTIFRRKAWAICALMVVGMPFVLPMLSSSTENPAMYKPALAQAAWVMAWVCTVFWGFHAASRIGDRLSRTGLGEYFRSSGMSATRQLLELWAALMVFIAPLGVAAALVCIFAASPSAPDESAMWLATNLQYALLFILVVAPLLALALALASRFGNLTGFLLSAGLTVYGFYGVGYMKLLLAVEGNPVLTWLWSASPHYHLADPTERLRYKLGAIEWGQFPLLVGYFAGISLLYLALSRLLFRVKATT
jgi:hypothetical protein